MPRQAAVVIAANLIGNRSHGKNGGLGRHDERREGFHAKHSEVAHGKSSAGQILFRDLLLFGFGSVLTGDGGNLLQTQLIGLSDDWEKEAIVSSKSEADVDLSATQRVAARST